MKLSDFDFFLPQNLIASRPIFKRESSNLIVFHRDRTIEHRRFSDICDYLKSGDLLLLNNTKVFPSRIIASQDKGKKIDILFVKKINIKMWEVFYRGNFQGIIKISKDIKAKIWIEDNGNNVVRKFFEPLDNQRIEDIIQDYGYMPLPPYIKRMPDIKDVSRYQTVFARKKGSIAAPTAGLHFSKELLSKIKGNGVKIRELTLHIGIGTFKPIRVDDLDCHKMEEEYFEIRKSLVQDIEKTKIDGKKIIVVGTTSTRAIEGFISGIFKSAGGNNNPDVKGYTNIFIRPGYKFKVVDSLITNFHLPRSTPFLLVSAFRGYKDIVRAYTEAIKKGYRFLSFGDSMLIL